MTRDDEVSDLVGLSERGLGLRDVVGIGQDLTGEEVVEGGHGVAGEEGGERGGGDEQACGAWGVSGEGEEVDVGGEFVGGGCDPGEEFEVGFEGAAEVFVVRLAGEEVFGESAGVVELWLPHEQSCVGEGGESGAVGGGEVGEEDIGDLAGLEAGAFGEPGGDDRGGQAGVDEDEAFGSAGPGADEGGGGVGGADRGGLVPEAVSVEGADGEDVDAGHGQLRQEEGAGV